MRFDEIRFVKKLKLSEISKQTGIAQPRLSDFSHGKVALRSDEFAVLQKVVGCKITPTIVKDKWNRNNKYRRRK